MEDTMPWWLDLVLLVSGASLLWNGIREPDDVWRLLQMLLGAVALVVVLLGGHQVPLELLALGLALRLPSSTGPHLWSRGVWEFSAEPQQRSRSVRGSSSAIAPSSSRSG
ncbi:MAG: hypothetical protein MUD04_05810 [Cyanobium sp. Prado107]|nr:hypothetical protein [Cyanobium sp. Prado107]